MRIILEAFEARSWLSQVGETSSDAMIFPGPSAAEDQIQAS